MKKVSASYETFYYKLSPETYDKMMAMAQNCNRELEMDGASVTNCTVKRLSRRNSTKQQNKQRMSPQDSPVVVADDDLNPVTTTTATTKVDNSIPQEEDKPKGWRDVVQYDQLTVKCYVDQMRKNDPWNKMPRNEWREERDKMVLQYYNKKMSCLKLKLNLRS